MVGQDILDYYRSWLAYRRWYLKVPGVQACVLEDGKQRLSAAFGLADTAAGTPLTERHLFRIASHSKTFTAVTVLRLVERGKLRLDDPVAEHLPELAGSGLAAVTVRELLGHGGGVIRDSEDGDFWQLFRPYPDAAELIRIATEPSAAVTGRNERFKYSNIAYGLLGLVIERVARTSFADAVAAEILRPLGLADTGPELSAERAADYAAGHTALSYGTERNVIEHVDTRALAAATGFYATAAELAAFYTALLPGEHGLLGADAQRQLRHREWEVKSGESWYGLGVFLNKIGEHELFGHSGGYPGHITRTFACPQRRTVVSVLTNAVDGPAEPLAAGLFRLLDLAASASHQPAPDGERFTGRFSSLWGVQDVALLGGRLFGINPTVVNPADDPVALEVVDDTTLKAVSGPGGGSIGEPMRYEFAPDGSIGSVRGGSGMTLRPFEQPV
ncbi:MAG TPA: serine hydrolase domain-containing protein [Jatrophihabitans sp.]|nr:serine hydrolase domain-containing protein [Jatrophihabitans sp.]